MKNRQDPNPAIQDNKSFTVMEHSNHLHILQENEQRYIQLFQRLPVAVFTADEKGYIRLFNDAAIALWGRKPVPGKDKWSESFILSLSDGTTVSPDQAPLGVTLKNGRSIFGQELQLERPDGEKRMILSYPQLMISGTGKIEGAVNVIIDITRQKYIEQELEESEQRYRQLVETLPAAVYICDKNGYIKLFNETAVDLWGRTPTIGTDLWCGSWKIFNPDGSDLPLDECPMAVTLKKGKPVTGREIVVERPDGTRRHVLPHPQPLFDSSGAISGAVNMLVDITELRSISDALRQADILRTKMDELRQSEERYHRMVAEVQDYAIIMLNTEGNILNWNIGAEKIKGYKASEIIGKSFRTFYSKADQEKKLPDSLLDLAARQGRAHHEGWRVRKDGTRFWGSVVITAIHNDQGEITGYTKVTRDLTERKNAEELQAQNAHHLERKNKELEAMNQELASFAYVSSHDLQEPLRKIQTFASRILETEYETLSDRAKDYFNRMQNAALRMQTLIEDLLAYSRTNTAEQKFELTDLNKLLEDVKAEMKEVIDEKKATIESTQLPSLNVISFQMRQLFTNILGNALKFSKTSEPPHVRISTARISGNSISGIADPEKMYCHISFKDNGIGFEPEHSRKIFEVFQRLHGRSEYSGTGIGLAICKKIVDNHSGLIWAESTLDQGATFHIYLPES